MLLAFHFIQDRFCKGFLVLTYCVSSHFFLDVLGEITYIKITSPFPEIKKSCPKHCDCWNRMKIQPAVPPGLTYSIRPLSHINICRPLFTKSHTPSHILAISQRFLCYYMTDIFICQHIIFQKSKMNNYLYWIQVLNGIQYNMQ